ncbi:DNA ligase [Pantoea phage Phynn]|nr:DNA ligase [Pantoea phage Phynn]
MILEILNELATTTSITDKREILERNRGNELLREVFRITYTKQVMFYVKQFPTEFDVYRGLPHDLSWAISELMDNLATRKLTGHAARDHLRFVTSNVKPEDREVLRRIINRDLECGTSTSLANKTWPKLIPEQPQCLATAFSLKAVARIKYPAISQLKADGARCMTDLIRDTEPRKATRAGNEYTGLIDLDESLRKLGKLLGGDYVLDGELVYRPKGGFTPPAAPAAPEVANFGKDLSFLFGEDDEPEIIQAAAIEDVLTPEQEAVADAKREEGNGIVNKSLQGTISQQEQAGIIYQVWDLIPYEIYYGTKEDQKNQDPAVTGYHKRLEMLREAIKDYPNIEIVRTITVNNFDEAKADYNQYRLQGMEGSILKNADFVWRDSRVPDQVKIKNKTPIDLKIIGVYEHKKDPNKVGGFVVVDASGHAQTNTGSGLTDTDQEKVWDDELDAHVWKPLPCTLEIRGDLDRELIMANKDQYIGAIVEMEVDGLQRSKTRKKGDPEFSFFLPVIKKMRWDKSEPNDIYDVFADVLTK